MTAITAIRGAVDARLEGAADLLCGLIAERSTTGQEAGAQERMYGALDALGLEVSYHDISESLREDPEYSHADVEPSYAGRRNVVAAWSGRGEGRSAILSSHTDVVPAEGWPEAFAPQREGTVITGRGAADAKGQMVTAWLALAALRDVGWEPAGAVEVHSLIEEEVGGNGALALLREGSRADAAVILEATEGQVHPANRGALWFRLVVTGKPVHMGRLQEGVSALDKMLDVIARLKQYGEQLVAASRNVPQFERYEHPVQLNIGTIRGGEWPSMVPGEVTIEGGVGFLPNKRMDGIKGELREVIEAVPDEWTRTHYALDFPKLHNDAYAIPSDHPLPQTLAAAARDASLPGEVFGWNVSCDARLYYHVGNMPTVVFGPGQVAQAHSVGEHIDLEDVRTAAEALALFLVRWCGQSR